MLSSISMLNELGMNTEVKNMRKKAEVELNSTLLIVYTAKRNTKLYYTGDIVEQCMPDSHISSEAMQRAAWKPGNFPEMTVKDLYDFLISRFL